MKKIILLAAVAAAALSPGFASARSDHSHRAPHAAIARIAPTLPSANYGSYSGPDPYGVYIGGEKIGRDPDPNVRQELVYDWLYEHSW